MAKLRVKLILNEGGEGIPLSQLAPISEETEKFLRYLAADAGMTINKSDWIAREFENKSVRFNIEDNGIHNADVIKAFNHKLTYVSDFDSSQKTLNGEVQHRTLLQYAKIADALSSHEKLSFGLMRPNDKIPFEYKSLTKSAAIDLKATLTEEISYKGTIQGTIHNIAIADLWFNLRRDRHNDLVRCEFDERQYEELIDAAHKRKARIFVRGVISARRIDRAVQRIEVVQVQAAPELSQGQYEAFFGLDPDYTGTLSTSEFIDAARGHER